MIRVHNQISMIELLFCSIVFLNDRLNLPFPLFKAVSDDLDIVVGFLERFHKVRLKNKKDLKSILVLFGEIDVHHDMFSTRLIV
nr:MAG TPA: hypothetical protein [Caudoviricetes sp.]